MSARLRRTRVGAFDEKDAIPLEKLEALGHSAAGRDALSGTLRPVETALDDIPALAISEQDAARLKRGQPVLLRGRDAPIQSGRSTHVAGTLVAIGEISQGEFSQSAFSTRRSFGIASGESFERCPF